MTQANWERKGDEKAFPSWVAVYMGHRLHVNEKMCDRFYVLIDNQLWTANVPFYTTLLAAQEAAEGEAETRGDISPGPDSIVVKKPKRAAAPEPAPEPPPLAEPPPPDPRFERAKDELKLLSKVQVETTADGFVVTGSWSDMERAHFRLRFFELATVENVRVFYRFTEPKPPEKTR